MDRESRAVRRPYNRNQHATFGAPFVTPGRNVLDMSGTRGITDPTRTAGGKWAEGQLFQWPDCARSDGIELSLRDFHAIPGGQVYTPVLTDRSKPRAGSRFTTPTTRCSSAMCFRPAIIRGLSTGRISLVPTHGRHSARHRIRHVPFDEGLRKSVERGQLLGAPTYKFIGAASGVSTTFTIFHARDSGRGFPGRRAACGLEARWQTE